MDSESIQAGVVRMAVIRFYSQLHNLVFAIHTRGLHLKVLIAGRIVRIGVLIVAEVGRLLVILVGQALERGLNQFRIGSVFFPINSPRRRISWEPNRFGHWTTTWGCAPW